MSAGRMKQDVVGIVGGLPRRNQLYLNTALGAVRAHSPSPQTHDETQLPTVDELTSGD